MTLFDFLCSDVICLRKYVLNIFVLSDIINVSAAMPMGEEKYAERLSLSIWRRKAGELCMTPYEITMVILTAVNVVIALILAINGRKK